MAWYQYEDSRLMATYEAVILGAGISGLSAAWRLCSRGRKVLVLEASSLPGGKVRTISRQGYLLEQGPHTIAANARHLLSLCGELGLEPQAARPEASHKYVCHEGRLQKVPTTPWECLTSGLLSPLGKARLLLEPFQNPNPHRDESVACFARRRFGQEVLDNLLGPFISGIYGGDPELLSMQAVFPRLATLERQHGSILRGLRRKRPERTEPAARQSHHLLSFPAGLGGLIDALAGAIPQGTLRLNTQAGSLAWREGVYHVGLPENETITTRSVIVATPALATANLLEVLSPTSASLLRAIRYVPLSVVHFGLDRHALGRPLKGFGFLVSRKDRGHVLGCVWPSSMFEDRAPRDKQLLSCYVQGLHEETDEAIRTRALAELRRMFNTPNLAPEFAAVFRHVQAIPQYQPGHLQRIGRLQGLLSEFPGLYLCGSYLHGVSLDSCVASGEEAARAAEAHLHTMRVGETLFN